MAFISLSPEFSAKSFTFVENKFITKYLPVLDAMAVKVYLYGLYLCYGGASSFTVSDLAASLNISEEEAVNCFEYLDEFELVKITSRSPFEVAYLDAENISGSPKRYKPEKYADFAKSVQAVIKGRMISTNEYREYFYLMEEYGFEQNALLMIINYCVNLKGDDIRVQYIKKVAKSFAAEGAVTAAKVDEKLARFTSSTPALLKIFSAAGINRRPDVDDDRLYKKWNSEMGFDDDAIIAASKYFKTKNVQKLDEVLGELYRNKKFDVKEIEFYCKNKNSVYSGTLEIAKALGVYMQNPAPYVENYVSVWCDRGYELDTLKTMAVYCFTHDRKSFEAMNDFIDGLYAQGIVNNESVKQFIDERNSEDDFIKKTLFSCGLTRRILPSDRDCLSRWREWNFSDEMILRAAELAAGKNNPIAYMNGILSSWKNSGIFTADKIESPTPRRHSGEKTVDRAVIERHYADLRQIAEDRAEKAQNRALADETYSALDRRINELNIKLAFAESRREPTRNLTEEIASAEQAADARLKELGIEKADFSPHYSCKICTDTGYDSLGRTCECMKKFIEEFKKQ